MEKLNELPPAFYGVIQSGKVVMLPSEDGQWLNKTSVAEAFRALEQRMLVAEQGEKTFEDGFCSVRQDRDEWKRRAEAAEAKLAELEELLSGCNIARKRLTESLNEVKLYRPAPAAGLGWISCRNRLPENVSGKWSAPVAAVSDLGDVFQLSCMGGHWQRTTAFVESGAIEIVKWLPLGAPATGLADLVPDDTKRMDWLVSMCVEVRKPLRYGSEHVFHAVATTDEEDDYHATTLREQIDAILRSIEEAKK